MLSEVCDVSIEDACGDFVNLENLLARVLKIIIEKFVYMLS